MLFCYVPWKAKHGAGKTCRSVKQGRRIGIGQGVEAHLNLCGGAFLHSQMLRELIPAEKGGFCGFRVFYKGPTLVLAQDEDFYDAVGVVGDVVFPPVLHGDQPLGGDT